MFPEIGQRVFFNYMDNIDKRRLTEEHLYEVVGEGLVIRRNSLKKQQKVKASKAEYTFLQFHHLIWKWAVANHKLSNTELNVLLYIYPLITFSLKQFHEAQKELSATNNTIFFNLKKNGWFVVWSKIGKTTHYTLSSKANTLIARMHKMYMLEEQIPMSERRNVIVRSKKKKDVQLMELFKKFNKKITEKQK